MTSVAGFPIAPLLAIDGTEVAAFIGPLVPDGNLAFVEPADVRFAAQEPQQLDDDRAQMQFFGRKQWEAGGEVEAHLSPEPGQRARAGSVFLLDSMVEDQLHEIEILPHWRSP